MPESAEIDSLLRTYRTAIAEGFRQERALDQVRFVVFDSETSGLDERRDHLVTIGAVGVREGEICLDDCFETMVRVAYNSASVVVHGITRQESQKGISERLAIARFLAYAGNAVLVGHHVGFDCRLLQRLCWEYFDFDLGNPALDIMSLALQVCPELQSASQNGSGYDFSLDGLCRTFSILPHGRHTASGDAFLAAQIFLKLLATCRKAEMVALQDLDLIDSSNDFGAVETATGW